jgi:hypothetical protein
MKRSKEQQPQLKNQHFVKSRGLETASKDEQNHIHKFLDPESKLQFSHINKSRFQEYKLEQDIHCLKSTNHFASCNGAFKKMKIGEECLVFCKKHVNDVIKTIINIMFSGSIYLRHTNDIVSLLPHPHIVVNKLSDEWEVEVLSITVQDLINLENADSIGEWAIRQFDFEDENWFDVAVYFSEFGEVIDNADIKEFFYYFQGVEWELNYEFQYDCISIKNLSYVEEDEIDESDELDMEETD